VPATWKALPQYQRAEIPAARTSTTFSEYTWEDRALVFGQVRLLYVLDELSRFAPAKLRRGSCATLLLMCALQVCMLKHWSRGCIKTASECRGEVHGCRIDFVCSMLATTCDFGILQGQAAASTFPPRIPGAGAVPVHRKLASYCVALIRFVRVAAGSTAMRSRHLQAHLIP